MISNKLCDNSARQELPDSLERVANPEHRDVT
jgi:hypothetical protein